MSSSSSTVIGDEKFRRTETAISGDLTATNISTEAIAFSYGNPRTEETRGVMHSSPVTPFPPFLSDGMEDRCSVLIRFDRQDSTDKLYRHFNNRQFNSLEVSHCPDFGFV